MTDDTGDTTELGDATELLATSPVNSTYKILGQFTDDTNPAILGQNDSSSGTPIGVKGAVPSNASGYGLYTDGNAFVGGSLDVGTLSFEDSAGDNDSFTATEDASTGRLVVSNGGTPTHEFGTSGELNISGTFEENKSL